MKLTAATITAAHIRELRCEHCGNAATCVGRYEDMSEDAPACDECCGHGCEDGHCDPLFDEDGDVAQDVPWACDSNAGTRMRARCAEIWNARAGKGKP